MTGFIKLTLEGKRALVLCLDAIESVEVCAIRGITARTYVRTRSGAGHYVDEEHEPLQAMLLGQGRELSPAEAAEVAARLETAEGPR